MVFIHHVRTNYICEHISHRSVTEYVVYIIYLLLQFIDGIDKLY